MRLKKSIEKRVELIRGEPLRKALEVFFSSRRKRNEYHHFKTNSVVDIDWYSQKHGLHSAIEAINHFRDVGTRLLLAPCAHLSGQDGVSLSQWGVEFLSRTGWEIGYGHSDRLAPDDPRALRLFAIRNEGKQRIAVVTSLFGESERLMPIDSVWAGSCDFFLVSDRRFEPSGVWQHVHANYYNVDRRRQTAFVKSHLPVFFSDYDWVVWLDSDILLCADPAQILKTYAIKGQKFAAFKSTDRPNLVSAFSELFLECREDRRKILSHLSDTSRQTGFGKPLFLESAVFFLRPSDPYVQQMCNLWWRGILRGSKYDQLSFNLAISQTAGLSLAHLPELSINNSAFFFRRSKR